MIEVRTVQKEATCRCKGGCKNNRCACFKLQEGCSESCGCSHCKNPLVGLTAKNLTACAFERYAQLQAWSDEQLEALKVLPCEHQKVPLKALLEHYHCKKCKTDYFFSFCYGEVMQEGDTWHCRACHICRDWREWHCDTCNRCNYGTIRSCKRCGRSRYD